MDKSNINYWLIKEKAAAVKKLEEEIIAITTDDSLLQEMVNDSWNLL